MLAALTHIHASCHALSKQHVGHYLPVAGNIGIFCHYEDEYVMLTKLRETLTDASDYVYGKYFRLHEPINIPATDIVPGASYTHLYIRKPDTAKPQVGDLDFYMEPASFIKLKKSVAADGSNSGMRILERPDLDLIEIYDTAIDALGYIGTKQFR